MAKNVWTSRTNTDVNQAGNWSLGHVPAATEDIFVPAGTASMLQNTDVSAVALNSWAVQSGYRGRFGTDTVPLKLNCPTIEIGADNQSVAALGSDWMFIETVAGTAAVITIGESAPRSAYETFGLEPIVVKSAHASSQLRVLGGRVGVAVESQTSTASYQRIDIGRGRGQSIEPRVRIGSGVTVTTVIASRGRNVMRCGGTTVTVNGGELTIDTAGAITTLNGDGGRIVPLNHGTIASVVANGAEIDWTRSMSGRTVTALSIKSEHGRLAWDPGYVTISAITASGGPVELNVRSLRGAA